MNLMSRLIKLDRRIKTSALPVHLFIQKAGESNDKLESRVKAENHDQKSMLIVVKFKQPLDN